MAAVIYSQDELREQIRALEEEMSLTASHIAYDELETAQSMENNNKKRQELANRIEVLISQLTGDVHLDVKDHAYTDFFIDAYVKNTNIRWKSCKIICSEICLDRNDSGLKSLAQVLKSSECIEAITLEVDETGLRPFKTFLTAMSENLSSPFKDVSFGMPFNFFGMNEVYPDKPSPAAVPIELFLRKAKKVSTVEFSFSGRESMQEKDRRLDEPVASMLSALTSNEHINHLSSFSIDKSFPMGQKSINALVKFMEKKTIGISLSSCTPIMMDALAKNGITITHLICSLDLEHEGIQKAKINFFTAWNSFLSNKFRRGGLELIDMTAVSISPEDQVRLINVFTDFLKEGDTNCRFKFECDLSQEEYQAKFRRYEYHAFTMFRQRAAETRESLKAPRAALARKQETIKCNWAATVATLRLCHVDPEIADIENVHQIMEYMGQATSLHIPSLQQAIAKKSDPNVKISIEDKADLYHFLGSCKFSSLLDEQDEKKEREESAIVGNSGPIHSGNKGKQDAGVFTARTENNENIGNTTPIVHRFAQHQRKDESPSSNTTSLQRKKLRKP